MFKAANKDSSPPVSVASSSASSGSSLSSKAGKLRVTPEGGLSLVGDGGVFGKGKKCNTQKEQKQKFFATRSADGKWNLLMAPTSDPSRLFLVQPAPGHKFQMAGGEVKVDNADSAPDSHSTNMSASNGCEATQPGSSENTSGTSTSAIAVPVSQQSTASSVSPQSTSQTTTATTPSNTETATSTDTGPPCTPQEHKKPAFFKSRTASDREALKASAQHIVGKKVLLPKRGQTGQSKQGKKNKSGGTSKSRKKVSLMPSSLQDSTSKSLHSSNPAIVSSSSTDTRVTYSDLTTTVSSSVYSSTSTTYSSMSSISSDSQMSSSVDHKLHSSLSSWQSTTSTPSSPGSGVQPLSSTSQPISPSVSGDDRTAETTDSDTMLLSEKQSEESSKNHNSSDCVKDSAVSGTSSGGSDCQSASECGKNQVNTSPLANDSQRDKTPGPKSCTTSEDTDAKGSESTRYVTSVRKDGLISRCVFSCPDAENTDDTTSKALDSSDSCPTNIEIKNVNETDSIHHQNSKDVEIDICETLKDCSDGVNQNDNEKAWSDCSSNTDDYVFDLSDSELETADFQNLASTYSKKDSAERDVFPSERPIQNLPACDKSIRKKTPKDPGICKNVIKESTDSSLVVNSNADKQMPEVNLVSPNDAKDGGISHSSAQDTESEGTAPISERNNDYPALTSSNERTISGQVCLKCHPVSVAETENRNMECTCNTAGLASVSDKDETMNQETLAADSLNKKDDNSRVPFIGNSEAISRTAVENASESILANKTNSGTESTITLNTPPHKPRKGKKRKLELDALTESNEMLDQTGAKADSNLDSHTKPKRRRKRKSELENLVETQEADNKDSEPSCLEEDINVTKPLSPYTKKHDGGNETLGAPVEKHKKHDAQKDAPSLEDDSCEKLASDMSLVESSLEQSHNLLSGPPEKKISSLITPPPHPSENEKQGEIEKQSDFPNPPGKDTLSQAKKGKKKKKKKAENVKSNNPYEENFSEALHTITQDMQKNSISQEPTVPALLSVDNPIHVGKAKKKKKLNQCESVKDGVVSSLDEPTIKSQSDVHEPMLTDTQEDKQETSHCPSEEAPTGVSLTEDAKSQEEERDKVIPPVAQDINEQSLHQEPEPVTHPDPPKTDSLPKEKKHKKKKKKKVDKQESEKNLTKPSLVETPESLNNAREVKCTGSQEKEDGESTAQETQKSQIRVSEISTAKPQEEESATTKLSVSHDCYEQSHPQGPETLPKTLEMNALVPGKKQKKKKKKKDNKHKSENGVLKPVHTETHSGFSDALEPVNVGKSLSEIQGPESNACETLSTEAQEQDSSVAEASLDQGKEKQSSSQYPDATISTNQISDPLNPTKEKKKKKKKKLKILINLSEAKSVDMTTNEYSSEHSKEASSSLSVPDEGDQSKTGYQTVQSLSEQSTEAVSAVNTENPDKNVTDVPEQTKECDMEVQSWSNISEKPKKKKKTKKSKKLKIIFGSGQETSTREIPLSACQEADVVNETDSNRKAGTPNDDSVLSVQMLAKSNALAEPTVISDYIKPKKKRKKRLSELETLIHDQEAHAKQAQDRIEEESDTDTIEEESGQDKELQESVRTEEDAAKDGYCKESEAGIDDSSKKVQEVSPIASGNGLDPAQQSLVSEHQSSISEQPAVSGQQSSSSEEQPAVSEQQSSTSEQPAVSDQQPSTSEQQPSTSEQQPSTSEQQPCVSGPHSSVCEGQASLPDPQLSGSDQQSSQPVKRKPGRPKKHVRKDKLHTVDGSKVEKPKKKTKKKEKPPIAGVFKMPQRVIEVDPEDMMKTVELDTTVSSNDQPPAEPSDVNDTSMESDDEETKEKKAMKKFLTSHSFTKLELVYMFGSPFVVMERLAEQDVYFMSRRFRNARVTSRTRCSNHCRFRTLSYLCELNLIDCKPPPLPISYNTESQGAEKSSEDSPPKKKKKKKANKESDTAEGETTPKKKRKKRDNEDGNEGEPKKKRKKKEAASKDKPEDDVILIDNPDKATPSVTPVSLPSFPSATLGRIRLPPPLLPCPAVSNQSLLTSSSSPRFIAIPSLPANRFSSVPQVITIPSFNNANRASLPQVITIPGVGSSANAASQIILPPLVTGAMSNSLREATRASLSQAISNSLSNTRLVTPMPGSHVATTNIPLVSCQPLTAMAGNPIMVQASGASTAPCTTSSNSMTKQFFVVQMGDRRVLVPAAALSSTSTIPTTVAVATPTLTTAPIVSAAAASSLLNMRVTASGPTVLNAAPTVVRARNPSNLVPGSMARIVLSNRRPVTPASRTAPTASTIVFGNQPSARPNQPWIGPRPVEAQKRVVVTPGSQPQGIRVVLSGAGPVTSGTRFTVSSSRGGVFVTSRQGTNLVRVPAPRPTRPGKKVMTEEERLRKRARLEKKYPLPPGVVIKTEPATRGYSDEGKTTQANSTASRVYVSSVSGNRSGVNMANPIPVLSAFRGPIVIRQATPSGSISPRGSSLLGPLIIRMPNASSSSTSGSGVTHPTTTASSVLSSIARSVTTSTTVPLTYSLLGGNATVTAVGSAKTAVTSTTSSVSTSSLSISSNSPRGTTPRTVSIASTTSSPSSATSGTRVQTTASNAQSNGDDDAIYIVDSPPSATTTSESGTTLCSVSDPVTSESCAVMEASTTHSESSVPSPAHSVTSVSSAAAASPGPTGASSACPSPAISSSPASPAPSSSTSSSSRLASLGAMWVRQVTETPDSIPAINASSLQADRMRRLKEILAKKMENMGEDQRQKAMQALEQRFSLAAGVSGPVEPASDQTTSSSPSDGDNAPATATEGQGEPRGNSQTYGNTDDNSAAEDHGTTGNSGQSPASDACAEGGKETEDIREEPGDTVSQTTEQNTCETETAADGVSDQSVERSGEMQTETVERGDEMQTETVERGNEMQTETVERGDEMQTETVERGDEMQTETVERDDEMQTETVERDDEMQTETVERGNEMQTETVDEVTAVQEDHVNSVPSSSPSMEQQLEQVPDQDVISVPGVTSSQDPVSAEHSAGKDSVDSCEDSSNCNQVSNISASNDPELSVCQTENAPVSESETPSEKNDGVSDHDSPSEPS